MSALVFLLPLALATLATHLAGPSPTCQLIVAVGTFLGTTIVIRPWIRRLGQRLSPGGDGG